MRVVFLFSSEARVAVYHLFLPSIAVFFPVYVSRLMDSVTNVSVINHLFF